MEKKTISKAVEIQASKETVWKMLTEQPYVDEWTSSFMEGSHVEGEFREGSQILYVDSSGMGVVGEVSDYVPNKLLKVSILAEIKDGKPDFEGPDSEKWEGAYDSYVLSEKEGTTTLSVETTFPAEFYDDFVPGWTQMLGMLKRLAERN